MHVTYSVQLYWRNSSHKTFKVPHYYSNPLIDKSPCLLSSRHRMTPPTSCHHPTPHLICCPTRSKTSQPSSTWLTSAGGEQICIHETPEVLHWIQPFKAVIVLYLLQWVVVEQTRGVFPLLDVSPEPRAYPPLHKKPSRQRILQAAVRRHEDLQENQVLPGHIFIQFQLSDWTRNHVKNHFSIVLMNNLK